MKIIDITKEESNLIGLLMDLVEDHINKYELTGDEMTTLDKAEEILYRIWALHRDER